MKKGKNGGYTPFDLLELSIEDKPLYGGKLPSKLFQRIRHSYERATPTCLGSWSEKIIKN